MTFPCLAAAGLRFLDRPFPLEGSASLMVGLLDWSRLYWGFHVPHVQAAIGVGAVCTPGSWCPCRGSPLTRPGRLPGPGPCDPSCRLSPIASASAVNEASTTVTRPIFPLPGSIGWFDLPLDVALWLQTLPLPGTPAEVGTGSDTSLGLVVKPPFLSTFPLKTCDFVSQNKLPLV